MHNESGSLGRSLQQIHILLDIVCIHVLCKLYSLAVYARTMVYQMLLVRSHHGAPGLLLLLRPMRGHLLPIPAHVLGSQIEVCERSLCFIP